uniref:Uncharacterized protein n=1 Tax=Moniliophthora roreri TaxID=221103 RepID=A0A0W0GCS3_MONRR
MPLPTPPPPATSHPMPTTIVSPPSMPDASMSAPLSVAAVVSSTLPPASAPTTTAASSSTSQGNIFRATNAMSEWCHENTDVIWAEVQRCAPGSQGGVYLHAWNTVHDEPWGKLTELKKKPFKDKAKTINKNRFWDPPSEHITDNQKNLPAWISITLKPLIGTGWNQVTVAGPRSIPFRIPEALQVKYKEGFEEPLKVWGTLTLATDAASSSSAQTNSSSVGVIQPTTTDPVQIQVVGTASKAGTAMNTLDPMTRSSPTVSINMCTPPLVDSDRPSESNSQAIGSVNVNANHQSGTKSGNVDVAMDAVQINAINSPTMEAEGQVLDTEAMAVDGTANDVMDENSADDVNIGVDQNEPDHELDGTLTVDSAGINEHFFL